MRRHHPSGNLFVGGGRVDVIYRKSETWDKVKIVMDTNILRRIADGLLLYLDQLLTTPAALGAAKERGTAMRASVTIFLFFRPLFRPQVFPIGDGAKNDFLSNGKRKGID